MLASAIREDIEKQFKKLMDQYVSELRTADLSRTQLVQGRIAGLDRALEIVRASFVNFITEEDA